MKCLFVILGSVCVVLGFIGIFVPVLPTTPFLLLAAALYFRGSRRMYEWLLNHRVFGRYIRDFREKRAMPLHAKVVALLMLWLAIPYSMFFHVPYLAVNILLGCILAGVTWYILSLKTS